MAEMLEGDIVGRLVFSLSKVGDAFLTTSIYVI